MSDAAMKLVVVGAAGRMGQTLIRLIHSIDGVTLHAAVERPGSPFIGKDAGEISGLGPNGIIIGDDPLAAFLHGPVADAEIRQSENAQVRGTAALRRRS